MNKINKLFLIVVILMGGVTLKAQELKFGHINSRELLTTMPESDSAQARVQKLASDYELQMEEIKVKGTSHIVERSLDECGIRKEMGIIVVAIKRETGEMEFNHTSTSIIKPGDTLVAMGETKQLEALEELVGV